MSIFEIAIKLTQKDICELTAADIAEKYDGDIGAAAALLYEKHVNKLFKKHETTDLQKDAGTVITHPSCKTVYFQNEEDIPD